ncbi:MAG: TIGR02996 domain-containing protein [Archangium sp.]|nr:TIGR02996 domain-containing protein [Archangium sp.]
MVKEMALLTPPQALREAIAGWRKTKHPRFAEVAQWATTRALAAEKPRSPVGMSRKAADAEAWRAVLEEDDVLDLPRLLAGIGGSTSAESADRIMLLSKLNDPRVNSGLIELLAAPPYRARTALPFFRACAKALADSGDPRVRPSLEDLAARYKSILETSVGDDVTALLLRTVASIDQVKPGPLPAALEKKCAALEALFEAEATKVRRGSAQKKSARHDDEALLAAIYAAPADDTPRHVFADALSERGDARGEFIALQLARAKGVTTPAQLIRERELSCDAKRRVAWALPLSQGGACHLARGFPDELLIEPRMFKTIVGLPAVRMLHTVTGFERQVSVKQAKAFLSHETAAQVTTVGGLQPELLEQFETPVPWTSVGLAFLPGREHVALLKKVRELKLGHAGPALTDTTFAGMDKLEALHLTQALSSWIRSLQELVELHTNAWMAGFNWAKELGGLPKFKKLVTGSAPQSTQLEGLKLEMLDCRASTELDPDAVIAALPTLRELRVQTEFTAAEVMGKLMRSNRLSQLRLASVGSYVFVKPNTPGGTLEIRAWDRANFEKHAVVVAALPEGCVSKVLIRPMREDPWEMAGTPPPDEAIQVIRGAAKVPVELAWY